MNDRQRARLRQPGPKRILTCDGGGILGLISVEILAKLETDLRLASGNPAMVLADYFDFACGTSTGAIIATCVALGMETAQIRAFYERSGPLMFEKVSLMKRLRYAYDDEPLATLLRNQINAALGYELGAPAATLGDEGLRTLLMLVVRNHSTDSPWPVSNNPNARYNDRSRVDCNLLLPLWQLVRASTAAPTFFPPEVVTFAEGTPQEYSFVFLDGGITTYNNPGFLAFKMATAAPYQMNWQTGVDDLLIVSVGTGSAPRARPSLQADQLWLIDYARSVPAALMNAASAGWDMACRILGDCRFGSPIDAEFGDGVPLPNAPVNWTGPKQFTYVRYDPVVTEKGLAAIGCADVAPEAVQMMDSVAHVGEIAKVGRAFAAQVSASHFANFPPAVAGAASS